MSHAWCCPLVIYIVTDNTIECTVVVMLIGVVMVVLWAVCVVTMTTGCRNLLLRCEMRHWWLLLLLLWRLLLLTVTWTGSTFRTIQWTFAIRYETIWCRWWRLATGCSTIVEGWSDGWRFLRDFSSNVRLIWFYFTCTAAIISPTKRRRRILFALMKTKNVEQE